MTVSVDNAAAVAKEIKESRPDIITVIGGHHLTTAPEETLNRFPQFDIGVIGEGEKTLSALALVIKESGFDKDKLRNVNGLIFKDEKSEKFVVTPPCGRIRDLDTLPKPAFDLLPNLLDYSPPAHTVKKFPACNLVTSRGCPGPVRVLHKKRVRQFFVGAFSRIYDGPRNGTLSKIRHKRNTIQGR